MTRIRDRLPTRREGTADRLSSYHIGGYRLGTHPRRRRGGLRVTAFVLLCLMQSDYVSAARGAAGPRSTERAPGGRTTGRRGQDATAAANHR